MKKCKLGEIADFKTGPFGTQFKASEYTSSGYPVINVKNIGIGNIIDNDIDFISEETRARLSEHIIHEGDIVFARKGSVERHAYVRKEHDGWVQGSDCIKARITDDTDPRYISYFLHLDYVKQQLLNKAVGSTMPSMNTDILKDISIALPDKPEDGTTIANFLDKISNKIDNNQRIISTLESLSKTLYDYYFLQFDFPDEKGRPYKSSGGKMEYNAELGREIPAGWKVDNLYHIANYENGLACQKHRPKGNEPSFPVVKIREIHDGISSDTERVSQNIPLENIIEDGDILFSWSATLEINYWVGGKAGLNQHIFKVYPKDDFCKEFVYHQLKDYIVNFKRIAEARKTTMGHITKDHLVQSRIVIPHSKILDYYSKKASPIHKKIISCQQENRHLTALRDFLLPLLMNGQVGFKK